MILAIIIIILPLIFNKQFQHVLYGNNNNTCNDESTKSSANVSSSTFRNDGLLMFVNGETLNTTTVYNCFGLLSNDSNVCNGRGSCIGENNCSCLVGYFGEDCQNFTCGGISSNLTGVVCSGHGICVDFNTCQCDLNWHGSNCNVTECFSILQNDTLRVCNGHGICVQTDLCQCTTSLNYTGVECEIPKCFGIAANVSSVCSSHGTCSSPNNCTCDAGYVGSQCQYAQCFGGNSSVPSSVCTGGKGICVAPDTCQCTSGYVGDQCQYPVCYGFPSNDTANSCSGSVRGSCISNNTCSCNSGYTGNECQYNICYGISSASSSVCWNQHGDCIAPNNCNCTVPNFTGYDCSFELCSAGFQCNRRHGYCLLPLYCQCNTDWTGLDCSTPICFGFPANDSTNVCSGRGTCTYANQCACPTGWRGNSNCSMYSCDGKNYCSGHGVCVGPNNCSCDDGWKGNTQCSEVSCELLGNCNSKGSCTGANVCTCNTGWKGNANCTAFSCDGRNYCSGHGECVGANTCNCDAGYKGNDYCNVFSCELAENCNSHGSCSGPNVCSCSTGWKGNSNCSTFTCDGRNYCNGHGLCIGANTCQCDSGWQGNLNCSAFTCDALGNCGGATKGTCVSNNTCSCKTGYKGSNDCSVFTCDGRNNCTGDHGTCIGPNLCLCNAGWTSSSDCSVFSCSIYGNCSNHGVCIANNTCSCQFGWEGLDCNTFNCLGRNECSGHGLCVANNTCSCLSGWKGNANCSVVSCDGLSHCGGELQGLCISNNTCSCLSGWKGSADCTLFSCDGVNQCSGKGLCIGNNTCQCVSGWGGADCSIFNCNGVNECGGPMHGQCVANNTCQCQSGWKGALDCGSYSCDGVNECSLHGLCIGNNTCLCAAGYQGNKNCSAFSCELVASCSSHGNCTGPNACTCLDGYGGPKCDIFNCYGKLAIDPDVCSRNGSCVGPHHCECLSGFSNTGICNQPICFNRTANDTSVCNGYGVCIAPDVCYCTSPYYYGPNCTHYDCYGLFYQNPLVCSGRGLCSSHDNCACEMGYIGSNCQFIQCYEFDTSSTSVCSGRGICQSPNNCLCTDPDFSGLNCNITLRELPLEIKSNRYSVGLNAMDVFNNISVLNIETMFTQSIYPYLESSVIYQWNCSNCGENATQIESNIFLNGNSSATLSLNINNLPFGTFVFTLQAYVEFSENNVVYRRSAPVLSVVVRLFMVPEVYNIAITGIPSAIVISDKIADFTSSTPLASMNESIIYKFLGCHTVEVNQSVSENVTLTSFETVCEPKVVSYRSILTFRNSTAFIELATYELNVTATANSKKTSIIFTPMPSFTYDLRTNLQVWNQSLSIDSSEIQYLEFVVIFENPLTGKNFTTTSMIPIVLPASPPTPEIGNFTTPLIDVYPKNGVALLDRFIMSIEEWSAPITLQPLQYAVGFYDSLLKAPVRLSQFSTNTSIATYLPFIAASASSRLTTRHIAAQERTVQLVVFVMDKFGNVDWRLTEQVSVAPYNGTSTELLQNFVTFSSQDLLILSYDKSLQSINSTNTELQLKLLEKIEFDMKNPSIALNSLISLTQESDSLSTEVVKAVNAKLNSFMNNVSAIYQEEKAQYSYVKTKILTDSDTVSTVSLLSNLLNSGLNMDATDDNVVNLASITTMAELPSTLGANASLPVLLFNSGSINMTLSVFTVNTNVPPNQNQTLSNGRNTMQMDLHSISNYVSSGDTIQSLSISFISMSRNTRSDSMTRRYPVLAPVSHFTVRKDDVEVALNDMNEPILLSFGMDSRILTAIVNATNITLSCNYWNVTQQTWLHNGCFLYSFDNYTLTCACNHTTLFATFMQYNISQLKGQTDFIKLTLADYYIASIVFGIIYGALALAVLTLLIIFREKQPIKSRICTPYLGIVALLVECVLILIIQQAILVSEIKSNSLKSSSYDKDITNVVNWFGGIATIVVNTLNLTAILSFLLQVTRFQLMKNLYNLMTRVKPSADVSTQDRLKSYEQKIRILKALTSRTANNIILVAFAFLNVLYWLIFFILKFMGAISAFAYTSVVSITYMVIILTFGVLITLVFIVDIVLTRKFDNERIDVSISQSLTNQVPKELESVHEGKTPINHQNSSFGAFKDNQTIQISTLIRQAWRWFLRRDRPLYFRLEMVFFVAFFIFLIISQATGISTLESRFASEEQFKIGLYADTARFAFEVVYIVFYILAFGGFAAIVSVVNYVKHLIRQIQRNKQRRMFTRTASKSALSMQNNEPLDESEDYNEEFYQLIHDNEGFIVFEEYCKKEWSIENLYIYLDLMSFERKLTDMMEDSEKFLQQLYVFCVSIFEVYVKEGATLEVNIPSRTRKSFFILFKMVMEAAVNRPFCDNKYKEVIHQELNKKALHAIQTTSSKSLIKQDSVNVIALDENKQPASIQHLDSISTITSSSLANTTTVATSQYLVMWKDYELTVRECVESLHHQVVMNLNDTFSRFVFTDEYKAFSYALEVKSRILKDARFSL
ncbi:hypothetical protein C9374_013602 [Naegleria lovaniensis]|uniref:Uncharacterized protein n=1 Tax=Naegleria lovaniensis TaxID=51637 RepID=A0AA88H2S1_NAELO|nr:uncharacterized protein C9374_013602 [Naegleria lovaniensis]KAG2392117.1 hypothetical protein C9374_013602 [Naegleria lovaniensis]